MTTRRLESARTAYDDAVRAEREARIAAAPELRARARRRRAGLRLYGVAASVVVVLLVVVGVWMVTSRAADQRRLNDDDAARTAAVEAMTAMLSADPARADAYVDGVLGVSAGVQRERVSHAADALRATVAGFGAPSTGRAISAGVQGSADPGVTPVLVVAQASAPELVGGTPGGDRVAVRVLMVREGDRWLVHDTEQVS